MRLLCAQVIKDLLGESLDYAKVEKLTSDAKFTLSDVKASLAGLSFVLSSAAKYGVDGESLSNELQQLGLPKEHCVSLCKVYGESLSKLQTRFQQTTLKLDTLSGLEWRVDYVLGSNELHELQQPEIQLKVNKKDGTSGAVEPVSFTVTSDKFRVLLSELKEALNVMDGLQWRCI